MTTITELDRFVDFRTVSIILLEKHITELQKLKDDEMDELVGTLVDIETLFMILQRDPIVEDAETKQIYHYLFRLLRKSVASCSSPMPDFVTLGKPPYEEPSISRAVMALLAFRYGHLNSFEWGGLVDLGKILLHTINTCKLEPPSVVSARLVPQQFEQYRHMYTRYRI